MLQNIVVNNHKFINIYILIDMKSVDTDFIFQ